MYNMKNLILKTHKKVVEAKLFQLQVTEDKN
jgi:hypothetical protein